MVNVHQWMIELDDAISGTNEELADQLKTEFGSGPVSVTEEPHQNATFYVRVDGVKVEDAEVRAPGRDSERQRVRLATVTATEWSS